MRKIIARMKEPSTWSGFAILATLVGINPTTYNIVTGAIAGVAAAVSIFLPEGN